MSDRIKKTHRLSKKGIIAIVIAAVLVVAVAVASVYVSNNKVKVYSDILYILMDKERPAEDNSGRIMHIRKTSDFNPKDEGVTMLDAFEIYYNDDSGKEYVFKVNDKIPSDDQQIGADLVILAFEASALQKVNTIKSVAVKAVIVIAVVAVIGLIFLWYKLWSKKEDEEKAKRIAKSSQNQKKK